MPLELVHKLVVLDAVLVSLWLHTEEAPPKISGTRPSPTSQPCGTS
jgi:hypothetical protein